MPWLLGVAGLPEPASGKGAEDAQQTAGRLLRHSLLDHLVHPDLGAGAGPRGRPFPRQRGQPAEPVRPVRLAPGEAAAFLVYTLGFGPLVAALLVTWSVGGSAGIAELWERITKWRVEPRWYLIVFLLPVALALLSLAAGFLVGGVGGGYAPPHPPAGFFLPFF